MIHLNTDKYTKFEHIEGMFIIRSPPIHGMGYMAPVLLSSDASNEKKRNALCPGTYLCKTTEENFQDKYLTNILLEDKIMSVEHKNIIFEYLFM